MALPKKIPAGGLVITDPGGRVNYNARNGMIAFDRRTVGARDPRANGWFNVYTAQLDGSDEQSITSDLDFGWSELMGHSAWRHVGLPTWSSDGEFLLLSVEEIEPDKPASASHLPEHHVAMQPGRGVANSIALLRLADRRWWWIWHYADNAGLGSMHAYFNGDMDELIFSRMISYEGAFATWDIGHADLCWSCDGEPKLRHLRYFTPIVANDEPPMAEVNGWDATLGRICVSGNPIPGQQQIFDDVFTCNTDGGQVERLSFSSGVGGEPRRYCEHLVPAPDGSEYAFMRTPDPTRDNPDGTGTDVYVVEADGIEDVRASYFNEPGHPMYVEPQGGADSVTAARPTWVEFGDQLVLMTTALNWPSDDGQHGGQGPIIMFPAHPQEDAR